MTSRSLIWHIFPPFLLVTICALAFTTWYASVSLRSFFIDQTAAVLQVRARLVEDYLREHDAWEHAGDVDGRCKRLGRIAQTRLTVILASGTVIGDTEEDPAHMDNHAARPEVARALDGQVGFSLRYSDTARNSRVYVAVPVLREGAVTAVIRASVSLESVERAVRRVNLSMLLGAAVVVLVAAGLSLIISRRITRPINQLREGAERIARGDVALRLAPPGASELAQLAASMNFMADQLCERIQTITRQRNEVDTILSSMVEGVLAVDRDQRVISLNRAAATMFGASPERAVGQALHEIVRNPRLRECIAQALAESGPVEQDIVLQNGEESHIHLRVTVLRGEKEDHVGALLVLNDVTRLRRLERARSDFVDNVSHEIRTPITSIKGYAETLLDGALEDAEEARHFLGIIVRQSDRLNALVNDILALSTMERASDEQQARFELASVCEVIEAAVQTCAPKADEKKIRIEVACQALTATFSPPLLEQAMVNLLDNAIKYSDPGGEIRIEAVKAGESVRIRVADHGCGIPSEHLARLFERFYRVDKARSRTLGGTGLGLAIVKHIARVHGGNVYVESTPGQGSCFTIEIDGSPRRDASA